MNGLQELLRSDGYVVINKKMAKVLGLEATMIYSELLSKHAYFDNRGMLEDGLFFCTIEDLEESTTLSKHKQKNAIDKLVEVGLVQTETKGMPAKRYFKIIDNEKVLNEVLTIPKNGYKFAKNSPTCWRKIDQHVGEKLDGNKEQVIIPNNNLNNTVTVDDIYIEPQNGNSSNTREGELSEIAKTYEQEIGLISPLVLEDLGDYLDDGLSVGLILEAILEASRNNIRNLKYISSILRACRSDGIKTVIDFKAKQERFKKRKTPTSVGGYAEDPYKKANGMALPTRVDHYKSAYPDDWEERLKVDWPETYTEYMRGVS